MVYRQNSCGSLSEGCCASSAKTVSEYGINGLPIEVKFGIHLYDPREYESEIRRAIIVN
jgi:hypothetical protein